MIPKKMQFLFAILLVCIPAILSGQQTVKTFEAKKKYLNYPVQMSEDRQRMDIFADGDTMTYIDIRLANGNPDYWVFTDISAFKGKEIKLNFEKEVPGIEQIYQSNKFAGEDSLYEEVYRPQFHFTPRVGWNNDPNGLVYYDGEYHLFFQHNPYETKWGNMHWGHAVSKDLLHWEELNSALYPDKLGTMFSGSAVIDKNNTAGWGKDAMVAIYTADRSAPRHEVQCVAYSNDNGRTFTKYEGNPVISSNKKWDSFQTRDPKVFWYEPNKEWVMALFEVSGVSIYTSKNLKGWNYESHTMGFWECPELFQLPVDGDQNNKKWVMYGVTNTYMIGSFDGKKFTPEKGKYQVTYGRKAHAAQTFNNTPDGRRIQIAWGRMGKPGMPFSQMICFPTEMTLRTTQEGVRLFHEPVREVEQLHERIWEWKDLSIEEANANLQAVKGDLLHVKAKIENRRNIGFSIEYRGNKIVWYNFIREWMNDNLYSTVEPGVYKFDIEILIDKISMEAFIDNGRMYIVDELKAPASNEGIVFKSDDDMIIHELEISELRSIWE